MGYFEGLGDYNNTTGVQPNSSNVIHGNHTRVLDGDLYDEQNGNTTLVQEGAFHSARKGWSNGLVVGCDFATMLGASVSITTGLSTTTNGGGMVDTAASLSVKSVFGLDVDAKFGVQNQLIYGSAFKQKATTYRSTAATGYRLTSEEEIFTAEATKFFGNELQVIENLERSFLSQIERLDNDIDQCLGAVQQKIFGEHTVRANRLVIVAVGAFFGMTTTEKIEVSSLNTRLVGDELVNIG